MTAIIKDKKKVRLMLFFCQFVILFTVASAQPSEKAMPIKIKYLWGFTDVEGKVIVPPQFDSVNKIKYNKRPFQPSVFITYKNNYKGYIFFSNYYTSVTGEEIDTVYTIEPIYDSLVLSFNLIIGYKDSLMAVYDYTGEKIFPSSKKGVCYTVYIRPEKKNLSMLKHPEWVKRNKRMNAKDSTYALYNELLVYYSGKYYRANYADTGALKLLSVTEVKLSKRLWQQVKTDKYCNMTAYYEMEIY